MIYEDIVINGEIGYVVDAMNASCTIFAIRLDNGRQISAHMREIKVVPDIFANLDEFELDALEFIMSRALETCEGGSPDNALIHEIKGITDAIGDKDIYLPVKQHIRADNIISGALDEICDCLTPDFPIYD